VKVNGEDTLAASGVVEGDLLVQVLATLQGERVTIGVGR